MYLPSPGPKWEALQEPEQSSDDELDTEDGNEDTPGSAQAHPITQRRKSHTEATRGPPSAVASTSTNAVGDNSRSQMKRKEFGSLFTSKKRARHSDQDHGMDLDMNEHPKSERYIGVNRKPGSGQKIMGSSQPAASQSVSSTTMNRKHPFSNVSASPLRSTSVKRNLMRKSSGMKPPPIPSYKRAESKTMPASDPGLSVDKGKGKVLKIERMPSASQTTRHPSTKAIFPDTEIIEISEDDDSPPPSISQAKSKFKANRPPLLKTLSAPGRGSHTSRAASVSAPGSATKKSLPKVPIETIEIFSSDDEQLPSKAQERNVDRSSGSRLSDLEEYGLNPRRGQSRPISSAGGNSFDENADMMDIDDDARSSFQPASAVPALGSAYSDSENDLFIIPSSPQALSQELRVTDDANDNQATRGLHPLPSSSPSSSPKDNNLSAPPVPITSIASLTISSPQLPSTSTSSLNSVRNPITAGLCAGTSTGSSSNRLGFSTVTIPSSLRAPPLPDKHLRQFARKIATQPNPDDDEDTEEVSSQSSEKEGTAHTNANKGKGKEIRESSSSDAESISMRGLQAALAMESDVAKPQLVSPPLPKIQGQTLAEAITSAGQLNRTKKKIGRRLQGNTKDVPIDLTSDGEASVKDTKTDEDEKELKAAKDSSILLVNLLQKSSVRAAAATAAAQVIQPLASSPQEKRALLGPTRTQDLPAQVEPREPPSTKTERSSYPLPSPKRNIVASSSSLTAEMKSGSPVGNIFGATPQPKREEPTAFEFKSGTAVIGPPKVGPPKRIPLPKRPSAATIERILASGRSGTSQQPSPTVGLSGESDGKATMTEASSIPPILANISAPSAAPLTSPSSVPLLLSPLRSVLQESSEPFKRITPPKRSPLAMTEAGSVPDSSISSQQTPSTSAVGHQSGPSAAPLTSPSISLPLSPLHSVLQDSSEPFKRLTPPKRSPLAMSEAGSVSDSSISSQQTPSTSAVGQSGHDDASTTPKSSSSKLADVQPPVMGGSDDVQLQSPSKQPSLPAVAAPKSSEPPTATPFISVETTSTAADVSIAALETVQTQLSIVPTNFSDVAVQDGVDNLGLPFGDSPDDDEEECQAMLQTADHMDVVSSHDVQPSLQDSIVSNLDTSVSATAKASNEHLSVSPPVPDVTARKSSRISSSRSSRSASSGGLGTPFDYDFGPFDSVPVSRTPSPQIQEISPLSSPPKTYGGFRALTWKDFRKDLNNFTHRIYYAKDLPHALQDHINSMSEYTQMMQGMRELFKATILENTVEDEPDAPPIEIWNSVDTQSTPPWEFYYTNKMWLGEGVPPPDITNLVSCTCKGGCNPKSKTCACLLRQKEAASDPFLEFAYDKNGKLKIPGYPIFECNDLCGCSDECRNRVVQQGRKVSVSIGKTETKGWGVFAGSKKIPEGTYIGIYSGELLKDAEANERGMIYNKTGRTYLFDIDFHHLKEGNPDWVVSFTVDAFHAGNFTRFLNHSCDPNCRLYACYINEGNIQKPLLAIFSRRDIEPYEEICFNYQGIYDDGDEDDDEDDGIDYKKLDPDHGSDTVYGRCRCGAKNCTGIMFK